MNWPIQLNGVSESEDTLFVRLSKDALQVNNVSMLLFIYLPHLEPDFWYWDPGRRLGSKRVVLTKVLMDNFVHFQLQVCIILLILMMILEMNDCYQR